MWKLGTSYLLPSLVINPPDEWPQIGPRILRKWLDISTFIEVRKPRIEISPSF